MKGAQGEVIVRSRKMAIEIVRVKKKRGKK